MLSNPNLIIYACVAKGAIILAEFSSKEAAGIESLAQQCIEGTPPFHSIFSHTILKRTYTFLIDDPFAYFLVSHQDLDKSESIWFLNHLKCNLKDFLLTGSTMGTDILTHKCLQSHFNPIFSKLMTLDSELKTSPRKENQDPSLHSNKGEKAGVASPNKGLKKKKRSGSMILINGGDSARDGDSGKGVENKVDGSENCRDMHKSNGGDLYAGGSGGYRQKAQQTWRKQVGVVFMLDLLVIATLFGIWLWVCRGFKCMNA
ncbi:hypothetical protein like AT5G52990 [Hibiscus trionum]|uniref:Longin domain-containing protein n=1 Tax=Hibiscus trionum TaxID=183268 RepID=A0A9W7JKM8_HIBTR|nr:hypothetical protein like AT5G52990 [Hibiscus trionum]